MASTQGLETLEQIRSVLVPLLRHFVPWLDAAGAEAAAQPNRAADGRTGRTETAYPRLA